MGAEIEVDELRAILCDVAPRSSRFGALGSDTRLADLDPFELFLLVAVLEERLVGELPDELIEAMDSVDDVIHFCNVRSRHTEAPDR